MGGYDHLAEADEHGNVTAPPVYWEAIYQITDAMRARGEKGTLGGDRASTYECSDR